MSNKRYVVRLQTSPEKYIGYACVVSLVSSAMTYQTRHYAEQLMSYVEKGRWPDVEVVVLDD